MLYEKFFVYQESRYSLSNKIDEFVNDIDTDKLAEVIFNSIDKLSKNPKIIEMIESILNNFDIAKLLESNEEFKRIVSEFKQ